MIKCRIQQANRPFYFLKDFIGRYTCVRDEKDATTFSVDQAKYAKSALAEPVLFVRTDEQI